MMNRPSKKLIRKDKIKIQLSSPLIDSHTHTLSLKYLILSKCYHLQSNKSSKRPLTKFKIRWSILLLIQTKEYKNLSYRKVNNQKEKQR